LRKAFVEHFSVIAQSPVMTLNQVTIGVAPTSQGENS